MLVEIHSYEELGKKELGVVDLKWFVHEKAPFEWCLSNLFTLAVNNESIHFNNVLHVTKSR